MSGLGLKVNEEAVTFALQIYNQAHSPLGMGHDRPYTDVLVS